jgi:hypothetical protein
MDSKEYPIIISKESFVIQLKTKIAELIDVPEDRQRLIF